VSVASSSDSVCGALLYSPETEHAQLRVFDDTHGLHGDPSFPTIRDVAIMSHRMALFKFRAPKLLLLRIRNRLLQHLVLHWNMDIRMTNGRLGTDPSTTAACS